MLSANKAMGTDDARQQGLDGTGVTWGIVDSGGFSDFKDHAEFKDQTRIKELKTGNGGDHAVEVSTVAVGAVSGIAPKAKIVSAATNGYDTSSRIREVAAHAPIINVSMGSRSDDIADTYDATHPNSKMALEAVQNHGALIVYSTGNEGKKQPHLDAMMPMKNPGLKEGFIAVTAVGSDKKRAINPDGFTYANSCGAAADWCMASYGNFAHLVSKTDSSTRWSNTFGTSNAAPGVSGAAVLLKQKWPWASNDVLRTTLLTTADNIGDKSLYGWGLLNIERAINGPAQLAFGQMETNVTPGNYWFNNDISGKGSLLKTGAGTLNLNGNNSYSGGTEIQDGRLNVNKRGGEVLVNGSKAVLSGTGTVAVIENKQGTVDFTMGLKAGSFTQLAQGTAAVDLGRPAEIAGAASLNGKLRIDGVAEGYIPAAGRQETVLKAGSIDGKFSQLENRASLLLGAEMVQDKTTVKVDVKQLNVSKVASSAVIDAQLTSAASDLIKQSASNVGKAFAELDQGLAGEAVSGAVSAHKQVAQSSSMMDGAAQIQQTAGAESLTSSLYSLGASVYSNSMAVNSMQINAMNEQADKHLLDTAGKMAVGETQAVANGFYSEGTWKPSGDLRGEQKSSGVLIGAANRLTSDMSLGLFFTHQSTDWSERFANGNTDTADTDSYGLGATLRYAMGADTWVDGFARWNRYDTHVGRTVLLGDNPHAVTGKVDGDLFQLGANARKEFVLKTLGINTLKLTPVAGLRMDVIRQNSFTENGGNGFGFSGNSVSKSIPTASLGADLNWTFGEKAKSFANIGMMVEHDLKKRDMGIDGTFTGGSSAIATTGWSLPATRLNASIGVGAEVAKNLTLNLDAQVQHGNNWNAARVNAGLRYKF